MKRSWKTVIVIALLLVWAIGATVAFIVENARSLELVNESAIVEASYSRLREKYAELEEECDELRASSSDKADYSELALEVYADMLTQTLVHENDFDIETKIDEIIAREKLGSDAEYGIYMMLKAWYIYFGVSE